MYPVAKCEHAGGAFKEVMRGFRSERPLTAAVGGVAWGVKSACPEVRHFPARPSSHVLARWALAESLGAAVGVTVGVSSPGGPPQRGAPMASRLSQPSADGLPLLLPAPSAAPPPLLLLVC